MLACLVLSYEAVDRSGALWLSPSQTRENWQQAEKQIKQQAQRIDRAETENTRLQKQLVAADLPFAGPTAMPAQLRSTGSAIKITNSTDIQLKNIACRGFANCIEGNQIEGLEATNVEATSSIEPRR